MDTTKTRDQIAKVMKGNELRDMFLRDLSKNIAETLTDCGIARTCLNCDHWNPDASYGNQSLRDAKLPEGCKKFRGMPPPKVLVVGCSSHTDALPF